MRTRSPISSLVPRIAELPSEDLRTLASEGAKLHEAGLTSESLESFVFPDATTVEKVGHAAMHAVVDALVRQGMDRQSLIDALLRDNGVPPDAPYYTRRFNFRRLGAEAMLPLYRRSKQLSDTWRHKCERIITGIETGTGTGNRQLDHSHACDSNGDS